MIVSFRSKGLARLFTTGSSHLVQASLQLRAIVILDIINQAKVLKDLNLPGLNFHRLRVYNPKRFTIHVNGPWCITFEFTHGDARRVDLEQYH